MTALRFSLFTLALLGFAGWLWLRQPYSPSQDLAPVQYAAFQIHAPTPEAGLSLAEAAREWPGVRASTYNSDSDLLVTLFTPETTEATLMRNLQALASQPIEKKVFETSNSPKCPVPQEALAALPAVFLGFGTVAGLLFLWMTAQARRKRARLSTI